VNESYLLSVIVDVHDIQQRRWGSRSARPSPPSASCTRVYATALPNYVERFCPDRASADDIVQEIFIRAWSHLPRLDAGRVAEDCDAKGSNISTRDLTQGKGFTQADMTRRCRVAECPWPNDRPPQAAGPRRLVGSMLCCVVGGPPRIVESGRRSAVRPDG
jgi:Sigma-70 region 2